MTHRVALSQSRMHEHTHTHTHTRTHSHTHAHINEKYTQPSHYYVMNISVKSQIFHLKINFSTDNAIAL